MWFEKGRLKKKKRNIDGLKNWIICILKKKKKITSFRT